MNRWITPEEGRKRGYDPASVAFLARREEANVEAMALIREVERVFGCPPRPVVTLHVARGRDDFPILSPEEERKLAVEDPEEDWREMSDEKIAYFQDAFGFLEDEGKRFYLPAFIRHHLRGFAGNDFWRMFPHLLAARSLNALQAKALKYSLWR